MKLHLSAVHAWAAPGEPSASMRCVISTGRISVVVRGVLTTTVFHTCTAAVRTLYAVSDRAMNTRASTCTRK